MLTSFIKKFFSNLGNKLENTAINYIKNNSSNIGKSVVSSTAKFSSMAMPGTGEGEIKLFKLGENYALFQKNSYPIKKTINGISYPYALTIIPSKDDLSKFIHQISIETDCFMLIDEKPYIGITSFSGHQLLGKYEQPLTEENVLETFSFILKSKLQYNNDLFFLETIKPIKRNIKDQEKLAKQRRTTPMTEKEFEKFLRKNKKY